MFRRFFCWLMDVCPIHWQLKIERSSGPHSDDMETVCLVCEYSAESWKPIKFVKSCEHGLPENVMCGRCVCRLINDPEFRAKVERGERT